jgi:PEP-CTERM motif
MILSIIGAILLQLGTPGTAKADSNTYDMTWTGAYGPGYAVLTVEPYGGSYMVTEITGVQDGMSITGVVIPSALPPSYGYGGNDNMIFPDSTTELVDFRGLAFTAGGYDYNIFAYAGLGSQYVECSSANPLTPYCTDGSATSYSLPVTTLEITADTPEPSSVLLLSTGLLSLFAIRRKRSA